MNWNTLRDLYNDETSSLYIEYDGLVFDFQTNLILFFDKISRDEGFKRTGKYNGVFKFYEYGSKWLKMLIDRRGLTKKEMGEWFDDLIGQNRINHIINHTDDYYIDRKWKRGNFKELFITIERK